MGRCGRHGEIGVVACVAKGESHLLGHTLYFKGEDMLLCHYIGYTCWNHSQILATCEHSGCLHQCGQAAHGILTPEIVVAVVEEILMQAHVGLLLLFVELLIHRGLVAFDARHIALFIGVTNEEYILGILFVCCLLFGIKAESERGDLLLAIWF